MTTTAEHLTATAEDEAAVEAFLERFVTDLAGAASTVMTVIGDRLGLYEAMTGAGPLTAEDLAARTGLHPRLVTEWLASQTVSEYVIYDPGARTYSLPDANGATLSQVDSPAYLVAAAEVVTGQFLMLDQLETAFRTDGAVPYDSFPACMFDGVQRFFRTAYTHELAANWFPAVPGLVTLLPCCVLSDRLEHAPELGPLGEDGLLVPRDTGYEELDPLSRHGERLEFGAGDR